MENTFTALLIDDEPDIRRIGELALGAVGGWEVLLASGGREGVALAAAAQPDVILLDVTMPEFDGPQTLSLLQACSETRAIPVIFLTARVEQDEVDLYRALGTRGVLPKPFNPMSLAADVRALLKAAP